MLKRQENVASAGHTSVPGKPVFPGRSGVPDKSVSPTPKGFHEIAQDEILGFLTKTNPALKGRHNPNCTEATN